MGTIILRGDCMNDEEFLELLKLMKNDFEKLDREFLKFLKSSIREGYILSVLGFDGNFDV
jgi:hypothetical protein